MDKPGIRGPKKAVPKNAIIQQPTIQQSGDEACCNCKHGDPKLRHPIICNVIGHYVARKYWCPDHTRR
jgi:hypothetical protein